MRQPTQDPKQKRDCGSHRKSAVDIDGAACEVLADRYERHRSEETVLHRVVTEYWSSFRDRLEALGSLPKFGVLIALGLCALVTDEFVRELLRSYRWRAKHLFGLSSVDEAFPGAVTVIQRFDSALRLNVHAYTLVLDGVYIKSAGADEKNLAFLRLPTPTEEEVHKVAERTAKRLAALLKKRGRTTEGASSGEDSGDW